MRTPLIQHQPIPELVVGHRSDGKIVGLNLTETSPLFITYPDRRSWNLFIQSIQTSWQNESNIRWFLYLHESGMAYFRPTDHAQKLIETYILDDPGAGTLTSRKKFVKTILKAHRNHSAPPKKKTGTVCICIIEDIWEIIQKADRSDAQKIADLLRKSQDSSMYIIAGSSAGHRNLFPELLKPRHSELSDTRKHHIGHPNVNRSSTELILGTEGLIFRARPGGQPLEKWYAPITWQSSMPAGNQPEISPIPDTENKSHPPSPAEILPMDAQVYQLED
jgi:hypothetical protein